MCGGGGGNFYHEGFVVIYSTVTKFTLAFLNCVGFLIKDS